MAKLTPFALAAIAVLGACSTTTPPQSNTPRLVTNVNALRAGTGVVQSVAPAPVMAGAGSSSSSEPLQRLEIKMNDGRMQYVDTASREIAKGDRVQISEDRIIRKI